MQFRWAISTNAKPLRWPLIQNKLSSRENKWFSEHYVMKTDLILGIVGKNQFTKMHINPTFFFFSHSMPSQQKFISFKSHLNTHNGLLLFIFFFINSFFITSLLKFITNAYWYACLNKILICLNIVSLSRASSVCQLGSLGARSWLNLIWFHASWHAGSWCGSTLQTPWRLPQKKMGHSNLTWSWNSGFLTRVTSCM